jgi:hypothetical protein
VTDPKKRIYSTSRSWLIALVLSYVGVFIAGGVNLWYTNHVDRQSNQVWCSMINSLNERYSKLPPDANADAKQFATQIATIKRKYDC